MIFSQDSLIVWSVELENPTSISTIVTGKKIFSYGINGKITCLDSGGKIIWNYDAFGSIRSTPVIEKDLLAISTYEGDLFTININTGNLYQVIGIGELVTSKNIILIDLERDGTKSKSIIAGTEYGNLFCYDLYTLEQIWINNFSEVGIISPIISSDQKIFFYDDKGTLYCVNGMNGFLIWKWMIPVNTPDPVFKSDLKILQNNLYLVSSEGNLYCIDALLGTEKWNLKKISASGLIRTDKNNLIIPTNKNKLLIISSKTGKVEKEIGLAPETKEIKVTDLMVKEEKLLAGFDNGSVYELSKNLKPLEIFRATNSRIVSLSNIDGSYLITDYDGNLTLIKILAESNE